jgi:hypothetical protein
VAVGVNLPIGMVAIVLALRFVRRDRPAAQGAPFDVRGAALLSPGLAALVFGLTGFAHGQAVLPAVDVRAAALALLILGASVFGAIMSAFRGTR